jgi:hypothetical protein
MWHRACVDRRSSSGDPACPDATFRGQEDLDDWGDLVEQGVRLIGIVDMLSGRPDSDDLATVGIDCASLGNSDRDPGLIIVTLNQNDRVIQLIGRQLLQDLQCLIGIRNGLLLNLEDDIAFLDAAVGR